LRENMNRKEKEVMLKEEYKAEKLISIIRLYFIGFLALVNIAKHYHLKGLFHIPLIPSYLIFLLALGIYIEIQFFWKEKYYRFYNRAIKFFYISLDVAALSYFIYSNIIPNEIAGYINVPPETLFSLVFSLISTFLLIIGILRFNPSSLIYTGILLCISYIYSIQKLFVYPDFQKLFLDYGLYKPANNIFFISLFLMVPLSAYISIRLRNILVKSKRQELLERFLPAQVAEDALNGKIDISTGGNKYYATILFSDIRNFTTMSEESNPEEIVDFLNSYFNDMIEIIFHYRGSLDKIIGDGIMAIYGAPLVTELAPKNAVKTAVDMIRKLSDFNLIRQI
ncbi:MAG: adenylate/guanylate cyclase domain-containing protein, partial [Leptospiraceae bacterium]|nr:adenylate/guanylate cyclase domain-containing protein [Leptospiraceae bacterium]